MESAVSSIESALVVYLGIGALLLVPMHRVILPQLDASADGASWGFRVVVSPGLVALWPVLLMKWRTLRHGGDPHGSPDLPLSSRRIRGTQSLLIKLLAIALPLLVAVALYTRPLPPASADLPKGYVSDVR